MRFARDLAVCIALAAPGCSSLQGFALAQDAPAGEGLGPPPVVSLGSLYSDIPEFTSAMMGDFSMDVALVDLDQDGYMDMLMSNGSDMSPQPLNVFRNRLPETRNVFRPWPDWYSEVIEYMAGMAVGDINQDGWMDVAVAVAFDKSRDIATGSVKVFLNVNGVLQRKPAFETAADGFMPIDCALADVDADGDLDLIVPALIEGSGIWGGDSPLSFKAGRARIYLNHGGRLSPKPDWISTNRLGAGSVTAADFNQDGWVDLAFGSPQPAIYYGAPAPPNHITIPETAGWVSTAPPVKAEIAAYRIDAGFPGKADRHSSTLPAPPAPGAGLMLAVSPGCATTTDFPCESRFLVYLPDSGTEPVWASDKVNFPGGIALADLNQDGYLDLAAGQWGTSLPGGPIWLFQGPFPAASGPKVTLAIARVWQAIGAANVHCEPVVNETLRHTFTINGPVNVLTLPQRILAEVLEVAQDGRPLSPRQWTWSPNANWVALVKPAANTVVTVTYKSPKILDIATATWNPEFGSDVFFSFLKTCPE